MCATCTRQHCLIEHDVLIVNVFCVLQGQITLQGQQVAQTADGQTIVYQPVNADGTVLQQGIKICFISDMLYRIYFNL